MSEPRITRRRLLAGGAVAAAGAAGLVAVQRSRGGAPAPTLRGWPAQAAADFAGPAADGGWGGAWHTADYLGRLAIEDGAGLFRVPQGLSGVAADQPMPVRLLDHDCADGEQLLTFAVTDPTLRPGLFLAASDPFTYLGVTAERTRLVAAAYGRERRRPVAHAGLPAALDTGVHHLRVARRGDRLRATLWPAGAAEPSPQLDLRQPAAAPGGCGVLLVHPTSLRACTLRVTGYRLGADRFAATPPTAIVSLTGLPRAGAPRRRLARVWSAYPATITFEWATDAGFTDAWHDPPRTVGKPPYTALATIPEARRPRFWRARLRSPAGRTTVTPARAVPAPDPAGPLVLLAASCANLTGPPPNDGFARLLEAAPATPAALVYQGDIGYPNNSRNAAYAEAPDYFADRFGRFLAQPQLARLCQRVPVAFTMDDHDYGPRNNADRTTVKPWAIAVWNRIHADPATDGYFDFRFGDVHCLTLDGRRYADPVDTPDTPAKTKLGRRQLEWARRILATSDAGLFVVFSADTFAAREDPRTHAPIDDCFITGWPADYRRMLTAFVDVQLTGRRVLVLSGDAHGLRMHHHPDPAGRPEAAQLPVVEFICSGLRPELWSAARQGDPSLDRSRYVLDVPGAGMLVVDPPGATQRTVTLRAIDARAGHPFDAFAPLRLPFAPGPYPGA